VSSDAEGGGIDFGALLSQLGQVQENLQHAQEEAAAEEVEGSSGGGAVKVRVTGALEFLDVEIDPSVVDPSDVEMLEDLVLAAVRDGLEKASGLATSALGNLGLGGLGGLGGPPGAGASVGGGIPGLGGLAGIAGPGGPGLGGLELGGAEPEPAGSEEAEGPEDGDGK